MSRKERRKHARIRTRWPVSIVTKGGLRQGETEDISLEGFFIRCEKPLQSEEKILLTFKKDTDLMRVLARVAWTNLESEVARDKPTGMGVQFLGTPQLVE
jgi:hypothetical protein